VVEGEGRDMKVIIKSGRAGRRNAIQIGWMANEHSRVDLEIGLLCPR